MVHVIYNPKSGSGKRSLADLKHRLSEEKIPYQLHIASDEAEAKLLASRSPVDAEDIVLLIGGDGSLNHLINHLPEKEVPSLILLSSGSGNDFARGIGMRRGVPNVIRMLQKEGLKPCPLDCGEADFGDQKHRFMVSCGIGYDARVCSILNGSPIKNLMNRLHLGKLAYLIHGIQGIFLYEKTTVTVRIDGGRKKTFHDMAFLSIHNRPYEGGGFAFAPGASACIFSAESPIPDPPDVANGMMVFPVKS